MLADEEVAAPKAKVEASEAEEDDNFAADTCRTSGYLEQPCVPVTSVPFAHPEYMGQPHAFMPLSGFAQVPFAPTGSVNSPPVPPPAQAATSGAIPVHAQHTHGLSCVMGCCFEQQPLIALPHPLVHHGPPFFPPVFVPPKIPVFGQPLPPLPPWPFGTPSAFGFDPNASNAENGTAGTLQHGAKQRNFIPMTQFQKQWQTAKTGRIAQPQLRAVRPDTRATGGPFICPYENCSASFSTRFSMKRHGKRHTGVKPHVCSTCGRAFGEKSTLMRHVKLHDRHWERSAAAPVTPTVATAMHEDSEQKAD